MDSDEFWQVALGGHIEDEQRGGGAFARDENSSDEDAQVHQVDVVTYHLDFPGYPPFSLHLRALPLNQGIWSPLGAQAWYGSALLTALLLSNDDAGEIIRRHLERFTNRSVSALELGSGAVGLPSLALGWMLKYRQKSSESLKDRILLTDNDPGVLEQLESNIHSNLVSLVDVDERVCMPEYLVESLDWNDGYGSKDASDEAESTSNPSFGNSSSLELVIGSELVYTAETAEACAHVVQSILKQNPQVLIVIIQIADRDGWKNIFLPSLRQTRGVRVEDAPLSDALIHERASQLIRHGGSLDRFDYDLCYISRVGDFFTSNELGRDVEKENPFG